MHGQVSLETRDLNCYHSDLRKMQAHYPARGNYQIVKEHLRRDYEQLTGAAAQEQTGKGMQMPLGKAVEAEARRGNTSLIAASNREAIADVAGYYKAFGYKRGLK
jgi:hypothetical protein